MNAEGTIVDILSTVSLTVEAGRPIEVVLDQRVTIKRVGQPVTGTLVNLAPPVGLSLSIFGAAKTVYSNILAKGRDVQFPVDTPILLQLAPGPAAAQ